MKKIFLLLFCAGLLTSLHGQPIDKREAMYVSQFMGYPLTVGDNNNAGKQIAFNKLLPMNVDLQPMRKFQIGAIPDQTVWHDGDVTVGFYVLTDTLRASPVQLNYTIDFPPQGKIVLNEITGRFTYAPNVADVRNFTVTFTAQSGTKIITQDVKFTLMPAPLPEFTAFGLEEEKGKYASNDDYTIVTSTTRTATLNSTSKTVYNFSVSGKEVVFGGSNTKLNSLNNRADIEALTIFAERVVIKSAFWFKQTNVTIYAKELVFEGANASINTTPEMLLGSEDKDGVHGANAGNITLYIKECLYPSPAVRFICNGGKGQDVYSSNVDVLRKPGNGGNGGRVTSTVDVSAFCVYVPGTAGVHTSGSVKINNVGVNGSAGGYTSNTRQFAWLHPNWVSAVVKHANDAFLNSYIGFTNDIFKEYTQRIADYKASSEWATAPNDQNQKMELETAFSEMQVIMHRISQNLDYFGNPVGWVPMLSFEINKMAFEQEIDKAVRVMYLSYWLKNIDANNLQRQNACKEALTMVEKELTDNTDALNKLVAEIPVLQDKARLLEEDINALTQRVKQKRAELEAEAKDELKRRSRINMAAGMLSAVATIAPVVNCVLPGVGTAISRVADAGSGFLTQMANQFNYADGLDYAGAIVELFETAKSVDYKAIGDAAKQINISKDIKGSAASVEKAYDAISTTAKPLFESMQNLYSVFKQGSVSNEQIKAELDRMMATSREFSQLIEETKVLNARKEEVIMQLANTITGISALSVEVQKGIGAIDGLRSELFTINSQRDLRAMQYIDDMERRAKDRLLKYHYYMAKSYEYRLLKPYEAELDLSKMFERFKTITSTNGTLTPANFNSLKALYEEQISAVTSKILDEYNSNRPELTAPIRFSLTKEDLAALNSDRDVILNIFERGMIPPNHENVRIVNFKVYDMKTHIEGNQNLSFANSNLLLEHSGISKLRKDGYIYYFNHINSLNTSPITWSATHDAIRKTTDKHEPSFASTSLLYSLLDKLGQTNNIMIYSRPAAWADIRITKTDVISASNTSIVIDELVLELQYDYMQRPPSNRNLDVYARDIDEHSLAFMPYIEVSKIDKRGRSNGRSTMYRTYTQGELLTLTAPKEYGRYEFMNWVDKNNVVVSANLAVQVNMTNDVAITANYKYTGATLKTTDTLFVQVVAGNTTAQVENTGKEEMDWTAASNDTWIRIIAGSEGIDNGEIRLEFDENPASEPRIGSITVTSIEASDTKTIFVKQEGAHTVIFETNGGSEIVQVRVKVGEKITAPANPAKDKHTFEGWYKDVDFVNLWNFAADVVMSNSTLYAKWACVHEYEWSVTTAPTCTADGEETGICKNDATHTDTRPIAKLGHNYTSVITAPTCETKGYTTYTCSRGDHQYTADTVAALGHNYAWQLNPENENEEIFVCTHCGEISNRREVVCEHLFDEWETTLNPTCTIVGVKTEKCSLCGTLGVKTQSIPALGHDYASSVTEPTCETEGYTTYICSRGDHTYYADTVVAKGHEYVWTEIIPATCTTNGGEIGVCKHDVTHSQTRIIPALGHDYTSAVTTSTCETEGYTTYTCSRGDHTYFADTVAAKGHDYEWSATTPPTCTEDGEETGICKNDVTHTDTQPIAKLGHDYKNVVTAPTCEAEGYTTYTCSRGDHTYFADTVAAKGHSYEWVINPENANEEIEVCSVCGEASGETRPVTAVGAKNLSPSQVYPNPVSSILYIESAGTVEVVVTDARGSFICRTIIVDNGSIPTNDWKHGVYFVTLKTETGNSVHKVVKK
ncbi:MAG: InlB B-repeat-containing protein [Bacteroidetes bacterium]|nr:InlB B-repeat-containing protein [Bacteroidota bacterium]